MTTNETSTLPPAIAELAGQNIWGAWGWELPGRHATEKAKIPRDAKTGRRAKSNDPSTWSSYGEAESFRQSHFGLEGLCIFLVPPLIGVDLDRCRDRSTG